MRTTASPIDGAQGERQRIADGRTFECLEEGRDQDADMNQIADLRDRVARTGKRLASPGRATRLDADHDEQLPDAHEKADRERASARGSEDRAAAYCAALPAAPARSCAVISCARPDTSKESSSRGLVISTSQI